MTIAQRNNVQVSGVGKDTVVFAHGFGCDQNMWRLLAPRYAEQFKVVTFDHVGSGRSDHQSYDRNKYNSLEGYASDLVELVQEYGSGQVIVVGHSVSAMIGMLAGLKAPGLIAAHAMVGPSPCYVDDPDAGYVGGFSRADVDGLLDMLESNYLGWASNMAPAIMGAPERPELSVELAESFCRTDPDIAKQFARVTFLSDNRNELVRLQEPTLIIQSTEDIIAPLAVGEYMHRVLPNSTLVIVDNVGHCPHLSAPHASAEAIDRFIASQGF